MTEKSSISKDLDEFLKYLDIDRPTLRRALQEGIKRLLGPQVDNRIEPFLRGGPESKKEISA